MPSVAVIGASNARHKFGNKAVRAYLRQGWTVYPVNPNESTVEGLATFAHVTDIPGAIDRAALYVPPAVGEGLLDELAAKGIKELWVNPGAESDALLERAEALGLGPISACAIVDIGERP
jgi:predicted CoA-binding protein